MIEIINGNIFEGDADIICHQVNTYGIMGAGIALQIKEKCLDYQRHGLNPIGKVLYCRTKYSNVVIANLFSQIGMSTDYNAMKNCLQSIYNDCKKYNETVAIPYKIGCGIAGGDWNKVYGIIEEIFSQDEDVKCTIYKLEE